MKDAEKLCKDAGWRLELEYSNGSATFFVLETKSDYIDFKSSYQGRRAWIDLYEKKVKK